MVLQVAHPMAQCQHVVLTQVLYVAHLKTTQSRFSQNNLDWSNIAVRKNVTVIKRRTITNLCYTPFCVPKKITMPTADGRTFSDVSLGFVTFTVEGRTVHLGPIQQTDGTLGFLFRIRPVDHHPRSRHRTNS